MSRTRKYFVNATPSIPRFRNILKEHPDAVAALACAVLVFLGWQTLNFGWIGAALFILTAAYVVGGFVGKAPFVQAQTRRVSNALAEQSQQWEAEGKTVVWVAYAGEILGIIAVADTVRPAAAQAISRLKRLGVEQIVMLTGDNSRTAHSIAGHIGIDQVYAELMPEDKVDVIRQLQKQYQTVAMVGDGINDAPALAQASVGIAMGTAGSDTPTGLALQIAVCYPL